jgi:hypothetical protein
VVNADDHSYDEGTQGEHAMGKIAISEFKAKCLAGAVGGGDV